MLKWLVLGVFLSTVFGEDDYKTFNYCKLDCKEAGAKHSACDCRNKPPREEMLEDPSLQEFRERVLNEHNKWRDYIAAGKEERGGGMPKATNMMLMNYDMECEHIARCRAINSFQRTAKDKTGHDKCRYSMKSKHIGQNLYGVSNYNLTMMLDFNSPNHWYQEVSLVNPEYIKTYTGNIPGSGHFTQVVWWSANRVGCVRVHNPKNRLAWKYTLICDYLSTVDSSGNQKNKPIYEAGDEPCSNCVNGLKCEHPTYTSLCGKPEPIPQEGPTAGSLLITENKILIVVAMFLAVIY